MRSFSDRVVLITGAASGIGRRLAVRLASEGARIAALDRDERRLQDLMRELDGKSAGYATADVTDIASTRQAIAQLESQVGPTDILVAGAGLGRGTPAERFRAEDFNDIIGVNLLGVVNSIDAVLPGMQKRRQGHLVVLSSLASYRGMPMMGAYCASKAGVNALFDSLRVELKSYQIRTTTICPGWIRTPMTEHLNLPAKELMTVEAATERIIEAIRREVPFIAFPAGMSWTVWLLRHLPRSLSDWLTSRHLARARKLVQGT